MSQGNFACGELVEIQVIADNIWADSRKNIDYIADAESARATLENQTVTFTELTGDKDREISAKWLNGCSIVAQDCSDDCTLTGPELEGACQTYSLTQCKESPFSVNRIIEPRTSIYEYKEKVAVGMLRAMKAMDEQVSQRFILDLDSWAGVNAYTGGIGTVSGASTTIPAANWTMGLMSYFALVKAKNKFSAPYLLSGTNLFEANMNAGFNAGNDNGKGDAARKGFLPIYFDVFNIDTVLSPDKMTFMVEKGATAIISKAYYKNYTQASPLDLGKHGMRWSMPSRNLPGIVYDVHYDSTCSSSEITDTFKVKLKWDNFLNPTGCTTTNTGVLGFTCS